MGSLCRYGHTRTCVRKDGNVETIKNKLDGYTLPFCLRYCSPRVPLYRLSHNVVTCDVSHEIFPALIFGDFEKNFSFLAISLFSRF